MRNVAGGLRTTCARPVRSVRWRVSARTHRSVNRSCWPDRTMLVPREKSENVCSPMSRQFEYALSPGIRSLTSSCNRSWSDASRSRYAVIAPTAQSTSSRLRTRDTKKSNSLRSMWPPVRLKIRIAAEYTDTSNDEYSLTLEGGDHGGLANRMSANAPSSTRLMSSAYASSRPRSVSLSSSQRLPFTRSRSCSGLSMTSRWCRRNCTPGSAVCDSMMVPSLR